jgi:hypothetical protein
MKVMADNMNLQINNVHVRIEDLGVSKYKTNFSFGFCLDKVIFGKTSA